ncbi:DHHA1 domain-containing protein [Ditylenchus destructor]|uniref:DHHA1 domain-containing protein n=1 Tax=Ditylenchus destructor TaxID=166010 RepID=A0AAD4MH96_9BILA|nr:DHHA1 domain-containing protein [Ditylenchus destructor]
MNALIEASRLTRAPTATDLGFALGPRINAGGRVGKSDLGVRLLTTEDADEARGIAEELNRLKRGNAPAIEAEVQQSAEAIEAEGAVAVVAARGWHPGVIGIVAGRLKERLGRPAIVIAIGEDGIGKGSGRSIAGVDLGAAILAAKEAGLLIAGGGHAMAAGVTIAEDQIPALVAFLDEKLAETVERAAGERALLLDAVLAPGGVNPALVNAMEAGGPYGMGWPAPRVAAGPVRIIKCDVVGNGHVRAIVAGEDGRSIKCVAFRSADTPLGLALLGAARDRRLWIAGRAKIDDWGARPAAEIHIEDAALGVTSDSNDLASLRCDHNENIVNKSHMDWRGRTLVNDSVDNYELTTESQPVSVENRGWSRRRRETHSMSGFSTISLLKRQA